MEIEVTDNMELTEAIRAHATKKLARLGKYVTNDARADLELSIEKNPRISEPQVAELTVHVRGGIMRARCASSDLYAAIDLVIDRIRRQAADEHERRVTGRPHHVAKPAVTMLIDGDDEEIIVEGRAIG